MSSLSRKNNPTRKNKPTPLSHPSRTRKQKLRGAQLWNALDQLGEGVLVFDARLNCSYANHAAEKFLGKKIRELVGQDSTTFLPATRGACLDEAYARALKNGESFTVIAIHVSSQRRFQHRLVPSPDGLVDFFTDITEHPARASDAQASQARIAEILDSVMDAVISVDAQQNIVYFNPAAETMFRCTQAQVLGKSYTRFIPERYRRSHDAFFGSFIQAAVAQHTQGRLGRTVFGLRSDGEEFPVEASISLVTLEGQLSYTIILRDVTERQRNEAKIQKHLARLAALYQIDRAILSTYDLKTVLQILVQQAAQQLQVDAINLLRLVPATSELHSAATLGFYDNVLPLTRLSVQQSYAGRALLEQRIVHLSQLEQTDPALMHPDLVTREGFVAYYAVPLIAQSQPKGALEIFQRAPLNPEPEWLDFLETLAGQAAIAIDHAQLFEGLQRSNLELTTAYTETIEGWARALDLRDKETEGHSRRVTELTLAMCRAADMNEADLVHVQRGALLHDIGKMGLPDRILLKPDKLTPAEETIMRQHPQLAYDLLAPISYLRPALDILYCHHEKWDGTGYPRGLQGAEIPLAARLFAVVDVWDALLSDRPYRAGWTKAQVLQYIQAQAGKHFDPYAVEIFMRIVGEHE